MFRSTFARFPRIARNALLGLAGTAVFAGLAGASYPVIRSRVFAHSTNVHSFWVGQYDNYVIVDGDGSTDLDCWLYDSTGRLVSSDTDNTDTCVLAAPGTGTHRVVVRNFGSVYNDYEVWTRR